MGPGTPVSSTTGTWQTVSSRRGGRGGRRQLGLDPEAWKRQRKDGKEVIKNLHGVLKSERGAKQSLLAQNQQLLEEKQRKDKTLHDTHTRLLGSNLLLSKALDALPYDEQKRVLTSQHQNPYPSLASSTPTTSYSSVVASSSAPTPLPAQKPPVIVDGSTVQPEEPVRKSARSLSRNSRNSDTSSTRKRSLSRKALDAVNAAKKAVRERSTSRKRRSKSPSA